MIVDLRLDGSSLKYSFIKQNDLGRQSEIGRPKLVTTGYCKCGKSDSFEEGRCMQYYLISGEIIFRILTFDL
jgi:hypothetical protein